MEFYIYVAIVIGLIALFSIIEGLSRKKDALSKPPLKGNERNTKYVPQSIPKK
ncbi:MAG: hypothetical protein APG12_00777 [Candidatus Methanofastidiosum methylothiophilum]|uniref:Uncharacterized protein n=1 Tax=Candidatus Methanofastidiosum methylothiophilum TaxID=1705564 RepID=A0A150ITS4_9EURY|nr:MAG: hypothetical protein APG10_00505 [Candidatus Methanofastidiosum methylthiophilus]KYC48054.1 MAG: hypothetical protein APG11_00624 [Candidatus Methanofastidiosum methylthiophilus]KYC50445.1 MAG: hypothetical protein APG12_00777 [Candidatus Methanofastidiosum methylthiophilus]